jgi:lipid-A-disaccharide synthase
LSQTKYYIIAGEASGDLHGGNLIKELLLLNPYAQIRCWGGEKMAAAGANVVKHYKDLAFMGFTEVLLNLKTILRNISFCKKDILAYQPNVLVLIDYPGFNMRIAKWAKQQGIKVVYYISPQIWAWKENRVHAIKRDVDKMLVILPFEKDFYKKYNFEVSYVGHPLAKVVDDFNNQNTQIQKTNTIALLPGSRKQEITIKLPIMLSVAKHFPTYNFVIAKAPSLEDDFYAQLIQSIPNVSTVNNKTYALLKEAKAALVTSGTATLETALFKVPQVICYKGGNISYQIAKRLIKIKFIGLANLIMDKLLVKELIQNELTEQNLVAELKMLLENDTYRNTILNNYDALFELLSVGGNASKNAAEEIVEFIA